MKIDPKAKARESKRINRSMFKIRAKDREPLVGVEDMKEAYSVLRNAKSKRDERSRVYREYLNRTKRNREALHYEELATGVKIAQAA